MCRSLAPSQSAKGSNAPPAPSDSRHETFFEKPHDAENPTGHQGLTDVDRCPDIPIVLWQLRTANRFHLSKTALARHSTSPPSAWASPCLGSPRRPKRSVPHQEERSRRGYDNRVRACNAGHQGDCGNAGCEKHRLDPTMAQANDPETVFMESSGVSRQGGHPPRLN